MLNGVTNARLKNYAKRHARGMSQVKQVCRGGVVKSDQWLTRLSSRSQASSLGFPAQGHVGAGKDPWETMGPEEGSPAHVCGRKERPSVLQNSVCRSLPRKSTYQITSWTSLSGSQLQGYRACVMHFACCAQRLCQHQARPCKDTM